MDGITPLNQARQAIHHVLSRIQTHPGIGYLLGIGSESYALLTEAYATITGREVEAVRDEFHNHNAADPAADEQAIAAAVERAQEEWEPSQNDLEEFISGMAIPDRLELLQMLKDRYCPRCGGRVIVKPCACRPSVHRYIAA
jgi:DNA-directed RNA polymerase subunit RPC12/RpoP